MSNQYALSGRSVPLSDGWDVIVVGGGPAGCAAATAAARQGARTLLIEAEGALGGMGTLGLVPWFCGYCDGEKPIARGLAERVRLALGEGIGHLRKPMAASDLTTPAIDPELLKRIYDDMVTSAGAQVLFHTRLCGVEKGPDGNVAAILAANKAGLGAWRAKVYVDCTGDGDLAAWAGAETVKGDENGDLQPATACFVITHVDHYALATGPAVHFFDPESPVHKAIASGRYPLIVDLHSCSMEIGPEAWGFNTGHVFDVDATDPASMSAALIHGRKQVAQYHAAFREFHPAFANSHLAATGALLGVRETRRIVGDYVLTVEDYLARRGFDDEICRNAYNIDVHSKRDPTIEAGRSIEDMKRDIEKAIRQLGRGESYGVPYRCLLPRGLDNVLVAGRCISTDRRVNGSVRIMACCLTTGEAAGLAAGLAAGSSAPNVHQVDPSALRTKLREHGAYLP